MKEVTVHHQTTLPDDRPRYPEMSYALSAWYQTASDPMAEGAFDMHCPPTVQSEAREQLVALEPLMRPVTERVLREWLLPIPASVRNGRREPDETRSWVAAVALACAEVPGCLFNRKSQAEALRSFTFFPAAADIYGLLVDDKIKLQSRIRVLRRIVEAQ